MWKITGGLSADHKEKIDTITPSYQTMSTYKLFFLSLYPLRLRNEGLMNDLIKQNQNFLLISDVLSLNIKYSAKQCPKTEWQSKHSRTKVAQIWIIFKKMIHIFFVKDNWFTLFYIVQCKKNINVMTGKLNFSNSFTK